MIAFATASVIEVTCSFSHFTEKEGLSNNHVLSILEDKFGALWFGTRGGGVNKFDGERFKNFTGKEGLGDNSVFSMLEDKSGNLWLGTGEGGVSRYDGKSFIHFTDKEGLSDNSILSILEDKSGNLWFGTANGGVNKYMGQSFSHFTTKEGLSDNTVTSILEDRRGNLWLGTDKGGANKYDGKSFTHYTEKEGLSGNVVTCMLEDKCGNLWMGTWGGGVSKYDGKSFTHYTEKEGLISNFLTGIAEDKNGNLWFGALGGVSKYDHKGFTNFSGIDGINVNWRLLVDKNNHLWLGSAGGGGVVRYDGRSFIRYTEKEGLSNNFIRSILEDKSGNLWFATLGGVSKYDGKSFTRFTESVGLGNNDVWSIMEDKSGNLWFGSSFGVSKLEKNKISEKPYSVTYPHPHFKTYTYEDGFLGIGVNPGRTIYEAKDGTIWIGADDRLTAFHPGEETPDTIAPNAQLTGLTVFNESMSWQNLLSPSQPGTSSRHINDTAIVLDNGVKVHDLRFDEVSSWYGLPQHLSLPYDNNFLTFQFIGITMRSPKKVKYQYKLAGLDKNWSALTNRTDATYGNLPYGKYTFKVKAINGNGYWSKEFNYSFIIRPPWWHTWWAYSIYVFSSGVFIWILTWYRSRQLKTENVLLEANVIKRTKQLEESLEERYKLSKKIESQQALLNERLRISRELHDDMGSTLGSISIYSEVAKNRAEKNENANEALLKIGQASRELIDKMSDIVWSLNPNNLSFEQLQNRMTAFAAMILAPRNILYDFIADQKLNELQLTAEQLKSIFLIFKEALHNIVKYADCKTVTIKFCIQDPGFVMLIQDDGKGFDVYEVTNQIAGTDKYLGGNGIKNMNGRADDMNAQLRINSNINEGTSVGLILRLKPHV